MASSRLVPRQSVPVNVSKVGWKALWIQRTILDWTNASAIKGGSILAPNLYALGGNPEAAKYIGINENRYIIAAYALSGFFAGLCGYLWVARYSVASTQIAIGFELTVISACVVGGISVMGGLGTVTGCLLGALLIGLIRNALPAIDISQFWQLAISGAIILIAIIINTKTEQRREKNIMIEKD